ncbi:MAG: FAD-dependent oxidoreductase [Pseudomonadota bacterium]|nr:FAD-dependent oxidoreductase [Pseudomonadota bacterium]
MAKKCDILVAGGGIAGLTAALTAARLGRSVKVLTGDVLGGNLLSIEKIEGYPGFPDGVAGYELCPIAQGQAADAGADFAMAEVTGIEAGESGWTVTSLVESYTAGAVIIGTGAGIRELNVPGAEALKGRGVSHCASCDAPLLKDKPVVVVGGGDSAAQEALTLAEAASQVTIFCDGEALTAKAVYRDRIAAHAAIEVRYGARVEKILGDDVVTGLTVNGTDVACDGVFVYIGLKPNTGFLEGLLELEPDGRVPVDGDLCTQLPGLFAAGSVRAGTAGQATSAAGDGAAAAAAADAFLIGGPGA